MSFPLLLGLLAKYKPERSIVFVNTKRAPAQVSGYLLERKFEEVPVVLEGAEYETILSTKAVGVTLSGPPSLLESLQPGRLKAVLTSSESLLAFQRETIEAGFGAPIRDRYGVSEFCVSMTECAEHRLHVDMEFCLVEGDIHRHGQNNRDLFIHRHRDIQGDG